MKNISLPADEILFSLLENGTLSPAEIAVYDSDMKKRKVNKVHKHEIWKGKDGRWRTFIPDPNKPKSRAAITAMKEETLYDKLYKFYYPCHTLEYLFKKWQEYSKAETARDSKTEAEDLYVWNKWLKDTSIVKMDILNLKTRDYIKFFDNMQRKDPTRKQVQSVKTLINHIYGQAIMEDIEVSNVYVYSQNWGIKRFEVDRY